MYTNALLIFRNVISLLFNANTGYPETTNATDNKNAVELNRREKREVPAWEQLPTDQTDPWQVVPTQVFTPMTAY